MQRKPDFASTPTAPALARALAALGLLALGACAGPASAPVANSAQLVQQAYAENSQVRGVADALDGKLDQMLVQQTAMLAR